ncbi:MULTISPECIES: BatD family protein [unclassified Parabacteroides]|uniref:BatD family protein n=1 Tax=unclassified Parabacteroides TaxID=2649774 RepID=UPI002473C441|nr:MULTISPECIES: BatD family protein [unclassified Parabacteroides]
MKYIRRNIILLFILFVVSGVSLFAQVEFKALAPEAVVAGAQFKVTYTINTEAKDLRVQHPADFDVLMGPSQMTSQSTSIVNGKRTSELNVSYTYILMAKEEGTFKIPAATIKVANSTYTSNELSIKVLPPDKTNDAAQQGGQQGAASAASAGSGISDSDIFMRMIVSRTNVYEQEGFLVTFKLYFTRTPSITNYKFPEFAGFHKQEIELSEQSAVLEQYNGRNYQTVVLRQWILFPQQTGKITIEKGSFEAAIRVPVQQRSQSIFDDFFAPQVRTVNKTLTTPSMTIDVKPLPSGKPADFSGAVGNFTMNTNINATDLKANEAVTITTKISGTGNIRLMKNPEVKFPNDFDIYDPKISVDTRVSAGGVSGSKTIEYMAIPRFGGEFEIPAIRFSYFDPKSATYKTLTSESYTLKVERGEEGENSPAVTNFNNRESVRFLGQDIRYLKVKGIHFESQEDLFYGSMLFYLSYIVPALLFIVFFFIYRKQMKENANIALKRTKRANRMAVKRLKNAGKLLKENKKEAFYEEVLRALWGYLSDKLSIPQSDLTKDNVANELSKYGVGDELISEFMAILNDCEFARYAPSQAPDAMDKIYGQTVDAIGKMENTIKK